MGMNRRKFLAVSSVSALTATLSVAGSASVPSGGQTRFTAGMDYGDVFLNGMKVEDIVVADIREGYVDQLVRDANGRFTIESYAVKSERKFGHVQFVRRHYPSYS